VGVGLTQLQKIPIKFKLLAAYIAVDYGAPGSPGSPVFALSMVLYFLALGFLTGYLITRLALQREFEDSSGTVQVKTSMAEVSIEQPADAAGKDKNGDVGKLDVADKPFGQANTTSKKEDEIRQANGLGKEVKTRGEEKNGTEATPNATETTSDTETKAEEGD
jgi:hypothetical protein